MAQTSQEAGHDVIGLEVERKVGQYSLKASRADPTELGRPITDPEVAEALCATNFRRLALR